MHDIGKVEGHSRPAASLERLRGYGVDDPVLLALVKAHDLNQPWWQSAQRGKAPSERAWQRLARKVDVRLLALFMIADRADAPGGWRSNAPLMWFLEQAIERGLLSFELDQVDSAEADPHAHVERCAGALLVREHEGEPQVLVMRVRPKLWELPKGHIEVGEDPKGAAARELSEETGLQSPVRVHEYAGTSQHSFERDMRRIDKHTEYFVFRCEAEPYFGERPRGTKELRFISSSELPTLPLVNESLRGLIARGFSSPGTNGGR